MSRTVEEPIAGEVHRPAAPRAGLAERAGEQLRWAFVSLTVAVQVAWFTLVGWVGASLALLPTVLQGGPVGRRVAREAPPLRLATATATEDVAGR